MYVVGKHVRTHRNVPLSIASVDCFPLLFFFERTSHNSDVKSNEIKTIEEKKEQISVPASFLFVFCFYIFRRQTHLAVLPVLPVLLHRQY